MKKILLLLFLIFMVVDVSSQPRTAQKVRWIDLTEAVKDSIRASGGAISGDSVFAVFADTSEMVASYANEDGGSVYLKQLSSSNTNGGGFFVQADSSLPEHVISFDNATAGKQWIRADYLMRREIHTNWASSLENAYNSCQNGDKIIIDPEGTTITSRLNIDKEVTISGNGWNCVVDGNMSGSYPDADQTGLWIVSDNVLLENFTMDTVAVILDSTFKNLIIRNVHFKNYSYTASSRGAIFSNSGDNTGIEDFENIEISGCVIEDFQGGGIVIRADTLKNVRLLNNIVKNGSTYSTSNYLIGCRGTAADSAITITGNQIYNISGSSRFWAIVGMGTPLVVSNNIIENITSTTAYGLIGIRGSSLNYVISNNVFNNLTNTAVTSAEASLIQMKGDGVQDSSKGLIIGNRAENVTGYVWGLSGTGTANITGNVLIGEFARVISIISDDMGKLDTCQVTNNYFEYGSITTLGSVVALSGFYYFSNNIWKVSGGGLFLYQRTSTPDSVNYVDWIFNNEIFYFDSTLFSEISDTADLKFRNCDFYLENDSRNTRSFIKEYWGFVDDLEVNDCNFYVKSTYDLYSLFWTKGSTLRLNNTKFYIEGSLDAIIKNYTPNVYLGAGTTFDFTKADNSIDIFLNYSSHDSIYCNGVFVYPKSKVDNFINFQGGASEDSIKYVEIINSNIQANSLFNIASSNDTIETVQLWKTFLDVDYLEVGYENITTFTNDVNANGLSTVALQTAGGQGDPDTLTVNIGNFNSKFLSSNVKPVQNYSAYFDSSTWGDLATAISLDSTADWTIEFWSKAEGDTIGVILASDTGSCRFTNPTGANPLQFMYVSPENFTLVNNSATSNIWWHWALVNIAASDTALLYRNGGLVSSKDHNLRAVLNQIGYGDDYTFEYEGWIDDIRIWNRAKTTQEIFDSLEVELTGSEADLLYYWKFDQALTSSATANTITITDGAISYSTDVPFFYDASTSEGTFNNTYEYIFLAPNIAYQYGDSLAFVYLTATDSVYYNLQIPYVLSSYDVTIDSIQIYVNGDAASFIDYVKLQQSSYGTLSDVYTLATNDTCTNASQRISYTVAKAVPDIEPLLLLVGYDVNTSVKTYAIKVFCSK